MHHGLRMEREATKGTAGLLGKYHQHLVSPTWGTLCFSSVGDPGWAYNMNGWELQAALLNQASAQLGQWSKNQRSYNITLTKQVFILLPSLTLYFSPFYLVYTTALDTLGTTRSEKIDIQWEKKNLVLPHPWVNPPLNQWDAPCWLKGSTWPWQTSAGTLSMPVCLPPFLPHPWAHQQWRCLLLPACPDRKGLPRELFPTADVYRVVCKRTWETLKCFHRIHGFVKGVTEVMQ